MRNLCLLIAALMMFGCGTSPTRSTPQTRPLLDASLARPCDELSKPASSDYDVWQEWVQSVVLVAYGECAARHLKTVEAWPRQ